MNASRCNTLASRTVPAHAWTREIADSAIETLDCASQQMYVLAATFRLLANASPALSDAGKVATLAAQTADDWANTCDCMREQYKNALAGDVHDTTTAKEGTQ